MTELPQRFKERMRELLGNEYEAFEASYEQEKVQGLRFNSLKTKEGREPDWEEAGVKTLAAETAKLLNMELTPVPWVKEGYYYPLDARPGKHPFHEAGLYYIQEPSAMSVVEFLNPKPGENVLDLCAAPGGKSTHARSVLPEGSLLVANEVIRNRSQILAENLTKWGHPDVVVTNNDPADFSALPSFFDVILTDVPCSGEGMFRKDPVAVEEWSPENVEICWQRQRRIIADVWPSLKPGGILIYSTCTYNTKEDEENVRWIQQEFGAESLAVDIREEWNITGNLLCGESASVYHFFPHKTKGEGFFLSVLRKPETAGEDSYADYYSFPKGKSAGKKGKKGGGASSSPVSKENMATAGKWLNDECAGKYVLSAEGAEIHAFPQQCVAELAAMKQHLRVVQAGVSVGEVKGKDLIPAHALAMSALLLRQDVFATEAVSYEQAIAYLRKEAVTLPATAPRGYVLLTYRNIPLGFVKNIGNRANNLYPQEWRIRSGYLPEKIRVL